MFDSGQGLGFRIVAASATMQTRQTHCTTCWREEWGSRDEGNDDGHACDDADDAGNRSGDDDGDGENFCCLKYSFGLSASLGVRGRAAERP